MQHQVSLRDLNQHFAHYIKEVEAGDDIIITRHGRAIARIVSIPQEKQLTPEQMQARTRILAMMKKGLSLKGERFDRDTLHDR